MVRGPDCWMDAATLMRHCGGLCCAHSSVGGAAHQNRGCHVEMLRSLNARLSWVRLTRQMCELL